MTRPIQGKVERTARLRWIALGEMHVSPYSQRVKLNQARVNYIAAHLDLEQIGTPTVNHRDGRYYLIDGWHRTEALKQFGFADDDKVQCWTYEGLTEAEEAERFLKLSDTLPIDAMSKFRRGVDAGRVVECDIDRIVRAQQLRVTGDRIEGGVRAVGTLRKVYERDGAKALSRALAVIRDAYGTPGFEAAVIDGIGQMCGRYDGALDDEKAVAQLGNLHGGVKGLLQNAERTRLDTGYPKGHCVAAAAVTVINRGKGKKLPAWWRAENDDN